MASLFSSIRPLVSIADSLKRIAMCLEFIVRQQARKENVMWNSGQRVADDGTEPELFHTDPAEMYRLRQSEAAHFQEHGDPDE